MKRAGPWIKLAVGLVLVGAVIAAADPARLLAVLGRADLFLLFLAILTLPAVHAVAALGMRSLLRGAGEPAALGHLFRGATMSFALGLLSPGRVGELSFAHFLRQGGARGSRAWAAVLYDRGVRLAVPALAALAGVFVFVGPAVGLGAAGVFGALAGVVALGACGLGRAAAGLPVRWRGRLRRLAAGFRALWRRGAGGPGRHAGLVVVRWGLIFGRVFLVLRAVGAEVAYGDAVLVHGVTSLVSLAPVTVSGLGVREASGAYLFHAWAGLPLALAAQGLLVATALRYGSAAVFYFANLALLAPVAGPPARGPRAVLRAQRTPLKRWLRRHPAVWWSYLAATCLPALAALLRMPATRAERAHVERVALFVGYPRSGHSLVGSLLDAHPNVMIAHELDALKYVRFGARGAALLHLMIHNSRRMAAKGRAWSGYAYDVAGQWQGRASPLRVVGDKKGGGTTAKLRFDPGLLTRFRARVGLPVRIIHVTRNPFDNVLTEARGGRRVLRAVEPERLRAAAEHYLAEVETVRRLRAGCAAAEWLDLRYEDLLADPRGTLSRLCAFLGVEAPPDYLDACAAILFDAPHRSRFDAAWPGDVVELVRRRIAACPFLRAYASDPEPAVAETSPAGARI